MRGKFVNGILIGGLVGLIAAMYYKPHLRFTPQRYFFGRTRRLRQRMGRSMAGAAQELRDFMRR